MILHPPITHPVPGKRLLLFDADGTLRDTVAGGFSQPRPPNHPGEWQLRPRVREVLAHYDWTQVAVAICSNQGVALLGYQTESMARLLLQETLSEATGTPVHDAQIFLCPHRPDAGCACRTPAPLLLQRAIHLWQAQSAEHRVLYGLREVLYVGDRDTDREAAERCRVDFCFAADFFGWRDTPC